MKKRNTTSKKVFLYAFFVISIFIALTFFNMLLTKNFNILSTPETSLIARFCMALLLTSLIKK
jgi:antibiotic biosynthesis monooxygenase (ABM) superfamily enzyme